MAGVRPAASLYAVVRSVCAVTAVGLATDVVPEDSIPGGKPVTDVPGESPMPPAMTDEPVFVIVDPARIAKVLVDPRFTVAGAADAAALKALKKIAAPSSELAEAITVSGRARRRVPKKLRGLVDIERRFLKPERTESLDAFRGEFQLPNHLICQVTHTGVG